MPFLRRGRIAAADRGINHVIAYGQSLSSGWEGWPALSTKPRYDSLMLGRSVRPASDYEPVWNPVGEAAFSPLVATVQDQITGRRLDPSEVALLPRDSVALGETVLEAALAEWRGRLRATVPPRRLLASSAGVGGRSMEELSKGARPELFNRLRDCVRLARELAGGDYAIAALLVLQGENNIFAINGSTADRVAYKALFARLLADFDTDVVHGIAGQTLPPAVFTYQVGGGFGDDRLAIPQAQLEAALEGERVFLAAPVYPVTCKGVHLDANGYRWLGAQFGKVMHRVITLEEAWRPLHPVSASGIGRMIRLTFHVPVPPLVWGRPYVGHAAWDYPARGFSVADRHGEVPVERVELGATHVDLHLARDPQPGCEVSYGDHTHHHGTGCLHDSDPTVARDVYEYDANTGHWPSAGIADLVGKPYPLANWCVLFRMVVSVPTTSTDWTAGP